ncbi:MAG TPA: helix-turn-helix domain-containing protein [Ignavibacteria bacterium]
MLKLILEKLGKIEFMLKEQSVKIMSLDELSKYLNFSKSHIYKLTSRNEIPNYKPTGKKIYFNKSEIDGWISKYRMKTKEEIEEIAEEYVMKHPTKY